MTNTVIPKITIGQTTLWSTPDGANVSSTPITFSIVQTDSTTAAYPAGGTVLRDRNNVELFYDAGATKPLRFSENRARLTNAELVNGLTAYVVGTAPSSDFGVKTKLVLVLDMLETSERKVTTDFFSGTKANRINVVVGSPGASMELEVKRAAWVTPSIVLGSLDEPDARLYTSGAPTPVIFRAQQRDNEATGTYDGEGELVLHPPDAKVELYRDAAKTDRVSITGGKVSISAASLRTPDTYYLAAAAEASEGPVDLTLQLTAGSKPTEIVVGPAVTTVAQLTRVNAVSPRLSTTIDPSLAGRVWFPPLAEVDPTSVSLGLEQTGSDARPYLGNARLTRGSAALELYRDKGLTSRLAFFGNDAVIDNAELTGDTPLELYAVGVAAADVTLELSLYDPKRRAISVGKNAVASLTVSPVNRVAPRVEYLGPVTRGHLTKVRIMATESNRAGAPYDGDATLIRSDIDLQVFRGIEEGRGTDPVFGANATTATVGNADLVDPDKVYFVTWTGSNPPRAAAALELELDRSALPYVVTQPKVELLSPVETPSWPVPLEGSNEVTPTIDTEYDLLLVAGVGTTSLTRTTPVRARLFVAQTNPGLPYESDGLLVRSDDRVQVFVDPDCKVAVNFSPNGEAVIPNAWLVDPSRVYYLSGGTPGTVSLTLSAAPPDSGFPAPPAIAVGPPATKKLAVVQLALQVFSDDGTQQPPVSRPMTPWEQHERGRFVPVPNPPLTRYGRAKLVLAKVQTADWPESADAHRIRISVDSNEARLELFRTESGTEVAAGKDRPLAISKQDAGAGPTNLWAQAKAASGELRDIRVDVGIDRTDGSGWEDPEPLRNGAWGLFTAVRIKSVAPVGDWKQYVNQPPDRSLLVNTNAVANQTGRGILVTATVEPARAGIGIDFQLWGKDGNGDATEDAPRVAIVPPALRAATGHATAVTNASGQASARLTLSRFGGDVFRAVAFVADNAAEGISELAEKGDHAPDANRSGPITVWRKLDYTLAVMKRWNAGDYAARANAATYEAKFAASFLELVRKGAVAVVGHQTVLAVGDASTWWSANALPAPAERTFNVVLADSISRAAPVPEIVQIDAPSSTDAAVRILGIYALGAQSDYLTPGSGVVEKIVDGSMVAPVPDGRISLSFFGPSEYRLRVDLGGLLPIGLEPSEVRIRVGLKRQSSISGFSSGPRTFVALRTREQRASATYDPTESSNHTMWHETGHYLGLTAMKVPDTTQTLDVYWYRGAVPNQTFYNQPSPSPPPAVEAECDADRKIGQGSHCRYSERAYLRDYLASSRYVAPGVFPQCIMYHALSTPITVNYCPTCEKALRARDLSSPKVSGVDDF